MSKLIDRFLNYVAFETTSNEESGVTPSTPGQMVLAKYLKEELESLGLQEVFLDDNGYLYATLPANTDKQVPVVGFIAHMDTAPDMSGKNVTPRIVQNYDGGDILLNAAENIVLSPTQFPELKNHIGEDLIVTDGNTLLGADDTAGIAEIISGVEYLMQHPEIEHGKVRIAFSIPMRRLAWALISLMLSALAATLPIPSTEVRWENWSLRTSTLLLPS